MQGLGLAPFGRSITCMSPGVKSARSQAWLESLGDWTWPGQHGRVATADVLPPAWVPSVPPAREPAHAQPLPAGWQRARRALIACLLLALALVSGALVFHRQLGIGSSVRLASARIPAGKPTLLPTPTVKVLSHDHAGSSIALAEYQSVSLEHSGSYYLYLPPGYRASAGVRYPVMYFLHGKEQSATAFLEAGLQEDLDSLIAAHKIPPVIAVMVQGGKGSNNWRNLSHFYYQSYVLEVQEIVDRTLPTIADRDARAIMGDSMGAYGAMELTLDNIARFGVEESWEGFFNGLEYQLKLDRPQIKALGLHAFVYGATQDHIANPAEDYPFAAELRSAGADAHAAIFPGEHNMQTCGEYMSQMLLYAGRWLEKDETSGTASAPTRARA
jgi:hypothetical protein